SVSAVACGLADFAIGTDTGGSVRVPASNCGVWGLRPSHGFISVAGVMPFAPTFDTVGIHARSADILNQAAAGLLGAAAGNMPAVEKPKTIYLLKEAFELAYSEVQAAHQPAIDQLKKLFGAAMREISLAELTDIVDLKTLDSWWETYCVIQWGEI